MPAKDDAVVSLSPDPLPLITPLPGTLLPTATLTATLTAVPPSATPVLHLVPRPLRPMQVERSFPNLAFRRLTNLVQPDDGNDRIFVTEQDGLIRVFTNDQSTTRANVFLDVRDRVKALADPHNAEEGLIGLAFDPDYADNGYFYVYYTADSSVPGHPSLSVLSRFSVSRDNPAAADPDSELVIMVLPQPGETHNGGQLAFGSDGYLYIGVGDGGGGPPAFQAQIWSTQYGSILRIDVRGMSSDKGYRVPPDNPLVDDARATRDMGVWTAQPVAVLFRRGDRNTVGW